MVHYKFRCEVENAAISDLDRRLANYAHGPHSTYQATKLIFPYGSRGRHVNDCVVVSLTDDRDRIALRESFDVRKVEFIGT